MNGPPNSFVRAATTQIRYRVIDVGVGGVRILSEKICRCHDESRLTIAALRHLFVDPRLLNRMESFLTSQTFERRDSSAVGKLHRQ